MYENYLTFGGVEIANTDRLVGYAKSGDCIVSWLKAEGCGVTSQAVGDGLPYTIDNIDRAPWYDIANHDLSSRFYGAMVVDQKGLSDSTRQASLTEGIADGGVLGGFRRAGREARFRLLLVANGRDAMDYGMNWLSSALDGRKCGQHGDRCGTTDLSFWVDCPTPHYSLVVDGEEIPPPPAGTMEQVLGQPAQGPIVNLAPRIRGSDNYATVAENHFTNPNLVGDGTWAEVRRNHAKNPSFTSLMQPFGTSTGTMSSGGSAVLTVDSSWSKSGNTSLKVSGSANSSSAYMATNSAAGGVDLSIWGGKTITVSATVRFLVPTGATSTANNGASSIVIGSDVSGVRTWKFAESEVPPDIPGEYPLSVTFTAPEGTADDWLIIRLFNGSSTGVPVWWDDLVIEEASTSLPYFDGSTVGDQVQPEDFRTRWLGAENASESVLEIERVRGLTEINAIAGVSSREGKPAMRVIHTHPESHGYVRWNMPEGSFREGGMATSTLHLPEPQTGALQNASRAFYVGVPNQHALEGTPPNDAGIYKQTVIFDELTSLFRLYWYSSARLGSTDVWWTDIGLFAGDYNGPTFSGDTEPERPEWRYSWEGEPNNSASVWEEKGTWAPVYENLFTNPRLKGDGTWTEVRRNRARRPRAVSGSHWGLAPGPGGSASMTHLPSWGTISEPFLRATVTRASTAQPNITNIRPTPTSQTWVDVTPGETITYSLYVAASGREVRVGIQWYVDGYTLISSQYLPYEVHEIEQPRLRGQTVTVPAGATSCRFIVEMEGAELGDSLLAGALMVGSGEEYFDGSTTLAKAGDIVQPEDFRWRWLGDENASESVMEIEQVAGLTGGGLVAGVSSRDGKPAVRLIGETSSNSYAWFPIPDDAQDSGTAVGTLHIINPINESSSANSRVVIASSPFTRSEQAPNEAGSYPLRVSYSDLTSGPRVRLPLTGGTPIGRNEVWWTDIGLYAGDYQGEVFNGSSDPAETGLAQPEDFRIRWTGAVDNSSSVMEIERVRDYGASNAIAGVSEKDGKPAIRIIPTGVSTNTFARVVIPGDAHNGGTLLGARHLDEPLTGSLNANRSSVLAYYGPGGSSDIFEGPPTPNEAGVYPVTLSYPPLASSYLAGLGHGGSQGSGDVWWTDIALVAGEYDGPAFNGDTGWVQINGLWRFTSWGEDQITSIAAVPRVETDYRVPDLTRFMHDTAVVSGPLLVEQLPTAGGDHVGTIVEFTVASERGYVYGAPKTLSLEEAELGSAADMGVNMAQNPRSRRVGSQLSTVVRNAVSNPSFETNLDGWTTAPLQSDYSISRPYRGPRSSGDYSMLVSGAGIFRVFHTIPASSRSGSSRAVASVWVSLTGPTEPTYASLIVTSSLGTVENRVTDNLPGRTITIEDIEVPATGDVTIEIQGDFPGTDPWNPGLMHVDAVLFLMEG